MGVDYRCSDGWELAFACCGTCWERRRLWVKHNVGHCQECRPDWGPEPISLDGEATGD